MKRTNSYSFDGDYKVRVHMIFVVKKIVLTEIVLALVAFLFNFFVFSGGSLTVKTSSTFYMGSFFLIANLIAFIYLFLSWNYKYYILSRDGISSNSGIILRKTKSIDMSAIRSIGVNQGLFGKVFNYGTLILESPLLSEKFFMYDLPNPFRHAALIDKERLKAINREGAESIIIGNKS